MDKPEVPDNCAVDFLFEAYSDLETCRTDAGSIPWTSARLYAVDSGLDLDAFKMFWLIIKAMDLAERKWASENPGTSGDSDGGDQGA